VVLKAGDDRRVKGKFLVGRSILDARLTLVFDDSAEFHKDISLGYNLRPLGGGWCEIDHDARTVRLSSSSQAFGSEPDRNRSLLWIGECLQGYRCEEVE
jgi:hypothetical protein